MEKTAVHLHGEAERAPAVDLHSVSVVENQLKGCVLAQHLRKDVGSLVSQVVVVNAQLEKGGVLGELLEELWQRAVVSSRDGKSLQRGSVLEHETQRTRELWRRLVAEGLVENERVQARFPRQCLQDQDERVRLELVARHLESVQVGRLPQCTANVWHLLGRERAVVGDVHPDVLERLVREEHQKDVLDLLHLQATVGDVQLSQCAALFDGDPQQLCRALVNLVARHVELLDVCH
mmetsp:Transcript_7245/g.30837  ORF Transcript_7245/g.30837 Transcript_7245/m.30837 type:complete len:235 (+) Transcript_7245:693-1397(+)